MHGQRKKESVSSGRVAGKLFNLTSFPFVLSLLLLWVLCVLLYVCMHVALIKSEDDECPFLVPRFERDPGHPGLAQERREHRGDV